MLLILLPQQNNMQAPKTTKNKLNLMLESAVNLGYSVEIVSTNGPLVRLSKDKKTRYIWGDFLPINTTVSAKICKYKDITKNVLSSGGIKTPKGMLVKSFEEFKKRFADADFSFPIVIKPNDASLGTNVFVGIKNFDDAKKSIEIVLKAKSEVLVEEFCDGEDHRVLVLNGVVLAACRRIQPFVIGDGITTLGELIEGYNSKRLKPIKNDEEFRRQLNDQKISLTDIIEKDRKVFVRGNANVSTGGMVEDETEKISGYFSEIAVKAVAIIGGKYMGVDIITDDISKSGGSYFVTEVNGNPDFDIHLSPDIGKRRDPRPQILAAIFTDR